MANINAPKGFVPVRQLDGSAYNGQHQLFLIPSTDGTAVGIGDVVVISGSSGAAGLVVNGMDVEGMATVIRAASGTTGQNIAGVVVGFLPDPTNLMLKHRLALTNRVAMVCTNPTTVYEVQEDAVTTPLAAADIGQNISFNVSSVNATTGISQVTIISAAKNTTVTFPVKIIGLTKRPDNNFNTGGASTDQAKFDVILNTQAYAPNTLGIA